MEHHGTARVCVVNDKLPNRRSTMAFEATDVTRSLQSTGVTCDHHKEVLFTKDACYVVPEGLLSPYLKKEDICQAFKREPGGGLYTRRVTVSLPSDPDGDSMTQQLPPVKEPQAEPSRQTFPRPGR